MAILINKEMDTGLVLKDGYFKITSIRLDEQDRLHFTGALWNNKGARDSGKAPLEKMYYMNTFKTEDKTGNLIKQAYEYITARAEEDGREKELFGEAKEG